MESASEAFTRNQKAIAAIIKKDDLTRRIKIRDVLKKVTRLRQGVTRSQAADFAKQIFRISSPAREKRP